MSHIPSHDPGEGWELRTIAAIGEAIAGMHLDNHTDPTGTLRDIARILEQKGNQT